MKNKIKMSDVNSTILLTTLNVNRLSTPIKRQKVEHLKYIQFFFVKRNHIYMAKVVRPGKTKQDSTVGCLQETPFISKDPNSLKLKGYSKQ